MKIAPGIHRIGGNSMINAYLVEQAGDVLEHGLEPLQGTDVALAGRRGLQAQDLGRLGVALAQEPEEDVEDDERPGVADVDALVDGGAADVEAHPLGVERLEALLLSRQGVVEEEVQGGPRKVGWKE